MKHFVFLFIMEKSGYTQKETLYVFFSLCWGRGTLVARPYDDQPSAVPGKSAGSLDREGGGAVISGLVVIDNIRI